MASDWPEEFSTKAKRRRYAYTIAAAELRCHVDSGGLGHIDGLTDAQLLVLERDFASVAEVLDRRSYGNCRRGPRAEKANG